MDTLKILKYKDLEIINQYDGKDFIINLDECNIKLRKRVIDFLCGYVQPNDKLKKINNNEFIVKK